MADVDDILALRRGLRAMPEPVVSAGFDAAVLAALRQPRPWWEAPLRRLVPALSAGVCSLIATVVVVSVAIRVPVNDTPTTPPYSSTAMSTSTAMAHVDLDDLLKQPHLSMASMLSGSGRRSVPSVVSGRPLLPEPNLPKKMERGSLADPTPSFA